jgi:MFS family permease
MRLDTALADRKQSVRGAAQEWLNAGWIGRDAYQRIETINADDRVRTGTAFRILFFILTLAAIMGFLGAICVLADDDMAALALVAGIACWGITEYLILKKKRRQGGIEAAFSVAAIISFTIGLAVFLFKSHLFQDDPAIKIVLSALSLLTAAAAWNWGYWPYMALSAGSLFFAAMDMPGDRLAWIILTIVLYPWLVRGCDSHKLPPSQRKCAAAFLFTIMVALYAAINIWVLDNHMIGGHFRTASNHRWLYILLTAALPIIVFAIGVLKRRRLFLILGFLLGLLSLITLRMYVHLVPLWVALTGAGMFLLAIAGALRRFLDSGVNRERAGFTADPLAERLDRHRSVEMLANIATLTPSKAPASEPSQFQGGGGEFGGGGASGSF